MEKAREQALKHLRDRFWDRFSWNLQRTKGLVLDATAALSSSTQ